MDHASDHVVVIVDYRPRFLAESGRSLLTLALGQGSLLGHLIEEVTRELGDCAITIAPTFEPDLDYLEAIRRDHVGVHIAGPGRVHAMLLDMEPSDWVLFVDPADLPTQGIGAVGLSEAVRQARLSTHIVALARDTGHADEQVVLDEQQRVRTIQRYYEGITNVQASGVFASYVSVSSLRTLNGSFGVIPRHLRGEMAVHGIPSHDITVAGGALDLREPAQLLMLNRQLLESPRFDSARPVNGDKSSGDDIHLGVGTEIDATARIYGPAALGDGAKMAAHAVIVGPAAIGRGVRIGTGALVAGAIVDDFATISEGELVCDRIVPGKFGPATGAVGEVPSGRKRASANGNGTGMDARAALLSRSPNVQWGRRKKFENRLKRTMDRVTAVIGLAMLSPVLAVVAALVKLTSRGPVLFGHMREGKDGREFRCLKFRTMCADAHAKQRQLYKQSEVDGPQFKISKDPRITWLGRILRATNIDELPQLINVARGEMSLVGPRPSPFRENQICVPWRRARLSVRPGITGLWQVCRHERSAGDFHQWIHYDMLYVENWSLLLDFKILIATVITAGGRFGMPVSWLIPAAEVRGKSPTHSQGNRAGTRPTDTEGWESICEMAGAAIEEEEEELVVEGIKGLRD